MLPPLTYIYVCTVKKVTPNSYVDNGGENQKTWGSENSCCFGEFWYLMDSDRGIFTVRIAIIILAKVSICIICMKPAPAIQYP